MIMKIEEKSCQNEGAFKKNYIQGISTHCYSVSFSYSFSVLTFFIIIVSQCPQKSTKECMGYLF